MRVLVCCPRHALEDDHPGRLIQDVVRRIHIGVKLPGTLVNVSRDSESIWPHMWLCLAGAVFAIPPMNDVDWLVIFVICLGFMMWGLQGIRGRKFPVTYEGRGFHIGRGIYQTGAIMWGVMLAALCGIIILGEHTIWHAPS